MTDPNQTKTGPLLLSIRLVAKELGLTPDKVRELLADGRLVAATIGKRQYVPAASVAAYLDSLMGREAS